MSSHRVQPGIATILVTAICLLFLGANLVGVVTYQDPTATKVESFIRLQRELRHHPQGSPR